MKEKQDLTQGPIAGNLFRFSLPLILTNLLQAVYNVADMAIAGQFVGPTGIAAINTSGQITNIILMIVIGFSNGVGIVTGQLIGSGKAREIKYVLGSMMTFFAILAIAISLLTGCLSDSILHILNIPAEAFTDARNYLVVCLVGTVFIYLYNTMAAVLRSTGDSVHPLMFMTLSTVLNIALDFLFMGILPLGTAGAALATITAQAFSMTLTLFYFLKKTTYLTFKKETFKIHRNHLKMVIKVGLPQACQFSATQFSLLIIAGMVNQYGVIAAAAVGASNKAGTFAQLPGQALNAGVLTTTAQNLPQKNYRRIIKSMFYAMALAIAISVVFLLLAIAVPDVILGIFTDDAHVVRTGSHYLLFISIGFVIENLIFTTTGVISGAGYTTITMAASLMAAAGRVVFAWILQTVTDLNVYSIGVAGILSPIIPVVIMIFSLASGFWKTSRIQNELKKI